MQNGSHVSLSKNVQSSTCTFCQLDDIATTNILKETPHFLVVADHAPVVEGHILIIPKEHYACYGKVPAELDTELLTLKRKMQQFFTEHYAPAVFWEHGVFRQTVFHAHLHCFPFEISGYNLAENIHSQVVHSQDDIRAWYADYGHYFYMEDADVALLFEPEMKQYTHVIQKVLWQKVVARRACKGWLSAEQRYEQGFPLIEATRAKWRRFEQKGVIHANKAGTR